MPGQVRVERVEQTGHGFTIEFEERWVDGGQRWYCREMIRADVTDGRIAEVSIYCTGDWDEAKQREHAQAATDGPRQCSARPPVYLFGAAPGKLPAQLYDVLARTTDEATRARLAAALARCWAYAGHPARAVRFADEAVELAQRAGTPEMVADCLDAALAVHWGPDELDVRRSLAARLDETAAHVLDPAARLQAHLWALQVACEALDRAMP